MAKKDCSKTTIISQTVVTDILQSVCGNTKHFKASAEFYAAVNINHRRWAKLVRGDLGIELDELKAVCDYFKIEFSAEVLLKQLKLFENQ